MKNSIRTFSHNYELINIRRKHIAECAAKLFAQKGYHPTTVRQIANGCGMAMGTLYHYIGSKDDILFFIIDQGVSQFEDFCNRISGVVIHDPMIALQQAIEKYYRLIDEIQDLVLFLHQEARSLQKQVWQSIVYLEMRVFSVFEKILTKGCEMARFNVFNIGLTVHNIVMTGQVWAIRRWYLRKHFTLEEYITSNTELFLKAISADLQFKYEGAKQHLNETGRVFNERKK